jgi:hypothetical protein
VGIAKKLILIILLLMVLINMLFFKITNSDEIHHGFPYKDGLNILDKPFQKKGSCVAGGLYFTDLQSLHHFYPYGVWIRVIIIPDGAQIVKDPDMSGGEKWRSDKIILGYKYPLYDLETIKKFNLKIDNHYVKKVCELGKVEILEWWKNSGLELKYPTDVLNVASRWGQVEVLEWWKNSGLELKYSVDALNWASESGHINVLEWWKNSGLKLKYSFHALYGGQVKVQEWWENSGLELKYTIANSLMLKSRNGGKISLELKYIN